jgi:hypothetical protein
MPCAGSRWPAEAHGSPVPGAFSFSAISGHRPPQCLLSISALLTQSCSVCGMQPILAVIEVTAVQPTGARRRDPEPSEPHGPGFQAKTCSWSCLPLPHSPCSSIATCARETHLSPMSAKTCRRHHAIRLFCIVVALTRLNCLQGTQSPTVIDAKRCVVFVVTRSLCVEQLARI